jgi:DNA polymerase-4
MHLDMDAFYASVEQRDRPELKGLPVIVGSAPDRRGVVCAASYEARKFGVRSAMPSRTAARLCPNGVFVPPRMDQYRAESKAIFSIVAEADLQLEQVSVDEAYMELAAPPEGTDPDEALRAALPLAQELKRRIKTERGLTASIGVAANKLLAKLASDHQKPDGLTLIPEKGKAEFLRPLPAKSIHGVGKVTAEVLAKAGIETIGDLQDFTGNLRALVGSYGSTLRDFAFGIDHRSLDCSDEIKSISSETTFEHDTDDRPTLRQSLREQAEEIAGKLVRRRLSARTVQVKVRYSDFTTLTRQISVPEPISEWREIYRLGCWLLARERLVSRRLRLLGLGVSGLDAAQIRQLMLPLVKPPGAAQ